MHIDKKERLLKFENKSSGLFWPLFLAARITLKIDIDESGRVGEIMIKKISLNIVGMGWETSLNAEVEGDKITFDRKEFDQTMSIIAETHDTISGGFKVVESQEELK